MGEHRVGTAVSTQSSELVWQERGGPMVSPPKQKGFGSHLIERAFETRPSAREAQRLTARLLR